MPDQPQDRKASNAERQARLRARRDAARQCRQCGAPALYDRKSKVLRKLCAAHLRQDTERRAGRG